MILRKLKLSNFRRFRDVTIDFPEGVVGIVGPNGAGKSTLFEAVAWALYGHSMLRTGAGFDLVPRGVPCRAELSFECSGQPYRVVRRLTGGGEFSTAQVFQGDTLLASDGRSARRAVRQILSMEGATFRKTIYCRQGEVFGLLRASKADRRATIGAILGLDLLDRVLARVRLDRPTAPVRMENPEELERELQENERARADAVRELELFRAELVLSDERRQKVERLRAVLDTVTPATAELPRRPQLPPPVPEGSLERLQACRAEIRLKEQELAGVERRIRCLEGSRGGQCPLCGGEMRRDVASAELRRQRDACTDRLCVLRKSEREYAGLWERAKSRAEAERTLQKLADREREVDAARKRIESLRREIEALGYDAARHGEIRRRCAELEEILSKFGVREAELRTRLELARRVGEQQAEAGLLTELEDLLRRFEAHVIKQARPILEMNASDILGRVTRGRYARLGLGEDFAIRMEDAGRLHIVQRFSGGEQDVAALSLRVALSRLLAAGREVPFLILDEVFGSQDRERRRGLLQALGGLVPGAFRQIFVVTHNEDVQGMLPAVLRVVEEADGNAVVGRG
jgi:DNA repair exonuclease SbcCD ATPase subunit